MISTVASAPTLLHFHDAYSSRPHFSSSYLKFVKPPRFPRTPAMLSATDNQAVGTAPDPPAGSDTNSASEIVKSFYDGINSRDLISVEDLIANDCVYEDLVFPNPFVGRRAIMDFFKQFTDATSSDLRFVIDDISCEDSSAVGVAWHLEWKGRPFPFSKGCSFYRLGVVNGKRRIVYGRDSVEPAIKPGKTVLAALRGVTWLFQRFPQLADRL